MHIIDATPEHFHEIQQIANSTWPVTFGDILSPQQIDYMLHWMYSLPSLHKQVHEQRHRFLLAEEGNQYLGFTSYQTDYQGTAKTKIHKIYILPNLQGRGIGQALLQAVETRARLANNHVLTLNVNRNNKAVGFYEKTGFKCVGEENIEIGQGFLMEDYIFEKQITSLP
jgi:GNAT superfamily N-acetyltransferase